MLQSSLKTLTASVILAGLLGACSSSPLPLQNNLALRSSPALVQSLSSSGAFLALNPALPAQQDLRQATVLSYLPIDDGLDFHIPFYLNALERTTSARTHQIAFTDANGPNNTFFHLIQPDPSPQIKSPTVPPSATIKEMTSNHPNTLASVINYTFSTYPGKFKAFTYLGHGGGFMGVATDNTPGAQGPYASNSGMLRLEDLKSAFQKGLKGKTLDLVHFHGCLMANIEVAYSLRGITRVMFASEDVVGAHQEGTEKPTEIMNTLLQQPNPDPFRIARDVTIQVQARANPYGFATASSINIERIQELKQAMNQLSQALIQALPQNRQAILEAYNSVPEFKEAAGTGQRDLWTFAKHLLNVPNPYIQKQAGFVIQTMKRVLIHTRDSEGDSANGMSIFMPQVNQASAYMQQFNYRSTPFAKDTGWDEFLLALSKI
jgi:hypothetical protein